LTAVDRPISRRAAVSATETHDTDTHTDDHHPTPRGYVNIAIVLGILTALEVSTYFFDFGVIAIPLLIVLMAIKFVMVVGFFMHLRFDTRIYGRLLYGGLSLAVVLYAITLIVLVFERTTTA
jgi:cytochrome c oxidase subunit IV